MAGTIACDLFTVPTIAFRTLFVYVVLHHGSRRILHVGITEHPTAEWAAQQLIEAGRADGYASGRPMVRAA